MQNPEIDTTRMVNVDDKKFIFYVNNTPRELEAGEEKTWPIFVCQVGAKHLVDRILQEKHNIKDTLRDSELRRSLFAQILPDMAEERKIRPLTPEEFQKKLDEELQKQSKLIGELSGKLEAKDDALIVQLTQRVKELEEKLSRRGRPPKASEPAA